MRRDLSLAGLMAKDTEKLIRQLSLISYLMAERRPVTALEIRRDVEGYSGMNEDAFARRFYADRAELESLGIQLTVDRPPDGVAEQENYSLRPENFHLPAIAFTDGELAALQTALSLLDGEFAYAEPLRLALQQLSWGRPSPLSQPEQQPVALGITASAGGQELSQRLAKVETAIFRGKTITLRLLHDGARRDGDPQGRPVPPALPGRAVLPPGPRPRARRAPRLPPVAHARQGRVRDEGRARLPVARRARTSTRASTPAAPRGSSARRRGSPRCSCPSASPGRSSATSAGSARSVPATTARSSSRRRTPAPACSRRGCCASASTSRSSARPSWRTRSPSASRRSPARHADGGLELAGPADPRELPDADADTDAPSRRGQGDTAIRPERFARLVTLASILIEAGRRGELLDAADLRERLQISDRELREDIDVLNVVSFGGGTYVLYAEVTEDGHDRGRPRALRGQLRAPGPAAARRGQGARRRDRPHRRAPARGRPDVGAREDRRRAGRGPDRARPAGREHGRRRLRHRTGRQRGDRRRPDAAAGLLQAQRGRVRPADDRAVRAHQRARGLVRRLVRPRRATTSATSGWTASATRR